MENKLHLDHHMLTWPVCQFLRTGWDHRPCVGGSCGLILPADGGFEPWPLHPEEAVARIEEEWKGLGRDPDIGEIVWSAMTGKTPSRVRQPPAA